MMARIQEVMIVDDGGVMMTISITQAVGMSNRYDDDWWYYYLLMMTLWYWWWLTSDMMMMIMSWRNDDIDDIIPHCGKAFCTRYTPISIDDDDNGYYDIYCY